MGAFSQDDGASWGPWSPPKKISVSGIMLKCHTYVIYSSQQNKNLVLEPKATNLIKVYKYEVSELGLKADRSTSDHGFLRKFCFLSRERERETVRKWKGTQEGTRMVDTQAKLGDGSLLWYKRKLLIYFEVSITFITVGKWNISGH